MFSKSVNSFQLKSLSLVTKLMLFYSLSTMGLLTAIGLFLYPTFDKLMSQINGTQASSLTAECYEKIIITLLLSSLVAIIFGHIVARNGLNRMRELESKMDKITGDSLHERINLTEWPKELKRFAEKFNTMLDRIEKSFIQLSQFSSDIAHELRTPINNLRGITEIALAKEQCSEEHQLILETYMNEYHHLSKLIENLLFLARSDHGQLTLKKELITARAAILNICDYYQPIADENNIELVCVGDVNILVDPTLFRRVMSNLLANALKYTAQNGKVSVHIVSAAQWVSISVHDTGAGIAEEHLIKIFDRFYRADVSRTEQSGGLGLGLAIAKSIIELHGGNLTIESRLKVGTIVNLKLPA